MGFAEHHPNYNEIGTYFLDLIDLIVTCLHRLISGKKALALRCDSTTTPLSWVQSKARDFQNAEGDVF